MESNLVDKYVRFNPQTGLYEPVWMWRDTTPYWLYPETNIANGAFTINAAAGAVTPPLVYKLRHASLGMDHGLGNPMLINRILFCDVGETTAAADWTVQLMDMGDNVQYMNRPIHVRTFAWTANEAGELSEPLFLPSHHNLILTPDKISGAATTAWLKFGGALFYTWSPALAQRPQDKAAMDMVVNRFLERRKYVRPFWLTTNQAVAVPAEKYLEVDADVGGEGHFEATHIMAVCDAAVFDVEFFNPQTRQTLMNGRLYSQMLGNAQYPQPLPSPLIVPEGQKVRMRFYNYDTADTANIYLTLRGRKIRAPLKDIAAVKRDLAVPLPQPQKAGA